MKLPICELCAKEDDLLCAGCQKKLENGEITASDIAMSRKLYRIVNPIKSMSDVTIFRIFDLGGLVVLLVDKGSAARLIGRGGHMVKRISKFLGKDVKILERDTDIQHMVESLIRPANMLGINVLYTKDGEIYRLRVPVSQKHMIHDPTKISDILALATNKRFEIVFE